MRDVDDIMRDRQLAVRRQIDVRGIALKAIAYDANLSLHTVLSYFPGGEGRKAAVIPMSAVFAIIDGKALPMDLISMLLPNGAIVVRVPEDVDHDALCDAMQDYLTEKAKAHRPESEAGRDIGPGEDVKLRSKAALTLVTVEAA